MSGFRRALPALATRLEEALCSQRSWADAVLVLLWLSAGLCFQSSRDRSCLEAGGFQHTPELRIKAWF